VCVHPSIHPNAFLIPLHPICVIPGLLRAFLLPFRSYISAGLIIHKNGAALLFLWSPVRRRRKKKSHISNAAEYIVGTAFSGTLLVSLLIGEPIRQIKYFCGCCLPASASAPPRPTPVVDDWLAG
jgi:hypothetical protein